MRRLLCFGLLALALVAAEAAPARADLPGPYPWSKRPARPFPRHTDPPLPPPAPVEPDPGVSVLPPDQKPAPPRIDDPPVTPRPSGPKRTGPFRSCGSGMGTGLAGIGLAWGMLWVGTRVSRRVRGS